MLEKLKKNSIKKTIPTVIIFCLIGIVLIALEFTNLLALLKGHVKFETLQPNEIKPNVIVDASIRINFGAFLEEYEENTKTHQTRTTHLYYVISTGTDESKEYRYIGIKVPASDMRKMDQMAEAYANYESFDPIEHSGKIQKMTAEDESYFNRYLEEGGLSPAQIKAQSLPYYINVGALTGGSATGAYIIFGFGVFMFITGILILIHAMNGGKLKTFKKEIAASGFTEMDVECDYESAHVFNPKNDLRIGNRFTFFTAGDKPHMLVNDKIVWVYQQTTTHTTNGVKTGTTYELLVYTIDDRKNPFRIVIPTAEKGNEILQYIHMTMPKAMPGFTDDLSRMFHRDYESFLNLRYNRPAGEGVPIGLENLKLF